MDSFFDPRAHTSHTPTGRASQMGNDDGDEPREALQGWAALRRDVTGVGTRVVTSFC